MGVIELITLEWYDALFITLVLSKLNGPKVSVHKAFILNCL